MNYLFFDIEAANRHDRIAKIYSFGYVVVSPDLEVIQEGEILINPKADYYFNINKVHTRIKCPGIKNLIDEAGEFPDHYERIGELLANNICIGYATEHDAYMLHESCQRYDLDSYRFKFYDLEEITLTLLPKKVYGLNNVAEYLGITNHNPHNGHSDAYATYEIYKKLVCEYKCDIKKLKIKSRIFRYSARYYKVFKEQMNKFSFVRKKVFKDMKIKDLDIEQSKIYIVDQDKGGEIHG